MSNPRQIHQCACAGCENLCRKPNIYCGRCAGYEHEMPKDERKEFLKKVSR